MKSRLTRLKKLLDLRRRELDERAARLAEANDAMKRAGERLQVEETAHQQAQHERAVLASAGLDPETWRTANEWLELRELHREAARRRLALAEVAVHRAHEQVLAARAALRRLEVLEERLKRTARRTAERKEGRAHDELAAQRAARERAG